MANTDSNEISEEIEIVLTSGAFERLLDTIGNENNLAGAFINTLSPSTTVIPQSVLRFDNPEILKRFRNSTRVADMWIRDFFRLRGNLAHGKIEHRYPNPDEPEPKKSK